MRTLVRRLAAGALALSLLAGGVATAQDSPAIVESEGEAFVDVNPDEIRFRLERSISGPTLVEAMRQARAFERSVAQGTKELDIAVIRQAGVQVRVMQQPPSIGASIELSIRTANEENAQIATAEDYIEIAERMRKLGVSVSSDVVFAGYSVSDTQAAERDAVTRAAEDALYLADVAGELAQRHVADVERVTIVHTIWEGLTAPTEGVMPVPPEVRCHARVRIAYRYVPGVRR